MLGGEASAWDIVHERRHPCEPSGASSPRFGKLGPFGLLALVWMDGGGSGGWDGFDNYGIPQPLCLACHCVLGAAAGPCHVNVCLPTAPGLLGSPQTTT